MKTNIDSMAQLYSSGILVFLVILTPYMAKGDKCCMKTCGNINARLCMMIAQRVNDFSSKEFEAEMHQTNTDDICCITVCARVFHVSMCKDAEQRMKEFISQRVMRNEDANKNSAIICPDIKTPAGGDVICTDANRLGSVCNFTCGEGRALAGDRTAKCVENNSRSNGVWNATAPYCPVVGTCHEMKNYLPDSVSGYYTLSSNSTGSLYRVYCDFAASNAGKSYTYVDHTASRWISARSCEEKGCYAFQPTYDISDSDMINIIGKSSECRQNLTVKCKGVLLMKEKYAWWVSRDSERMNYWAGAQTDFYCACGMEGNCINSKYKCNCDQNSRSVTTFDGGYLTDKSKLPLRELRLGDMGHSDEEASHYVGKLECWGEA